MMLWFTNPNIIKHPKPGLQLTDENPWDYYRRITLQRPNTMEAMFQSAPGPIPKCTLERGVNYFILALERLGAATYWSCEGHPTGFYIVFQGSYDIAVQIQRAGFFHVEVEGEFGKFSIRLSDRSSKTSRSKNQCLRWAAKAWETKLFAPKPQRGRKRKS